jgi:excisionase family DNA binding protein
MSIIEDKKYIPWKYGDKGILRMKLEKSHLTVKEIATDLDVSEETVRNWIRSGELKAVDIGRGYRVAVIEYQRFLEARSTEKKHE